MTGLDITGLDISGLDKTGPADVTVDIGSLRLIGFSRAEARRVEDGFRVELAQITGADVRSVPHQTDQLVAQTDGRGTPETVGAAAARALIAGLDP